MAESTRVAIRTLIMTLGILGGLLIMVRGGQMVKDAMDSRSATSAIMNGTGVEKVTNSLGDMLGDKQAVSQMASQMNELGTAMKSAMKSLSSIGPEELNKGIDDYRNFGIVILVCGLVALLAAALIGQLKIFSGVALLVAGVVPLLDTKFSMHNSMLIVPGIVIVLLCGVAAIVMNAMNSSATAPKTSTAQ